MSPSYRSPSLCVRVRVRVRVRDTYRWRHIEKPPWDTWRQVSTGDTAGMGTYRHLINYWALIAAWVVQ